MRWGRTKEKEGLRKYNRKGGWEIMKSGEERKWVGRKACSLAQFVNDDLTEITLDVNVG